ncbi:hypothetical protein Q5752_005343 [Cryptotrichosporon argae]
MSSVTQNPPPLTKSLPEDSNIEDVITTPLRNLYNIMTSAGEIDQDRLKLVQDVLMDGFVTESNSEAERDLMRTRMGLDATMQMVWAGSIIPARNGQLTASKSSSRKLSDDAYVCMADLRRALEEPGCEEAIKKVIGTAASGIRASGQYSVANTALVQDLKKAMAGYLNTRMDLEADSTVLNSFVAFQATAMDYDRRTRGSAMLQNLLQSRGSR